MRKGEISVIAALSILTSGFLYIFGEISIEKVSVFAALLYLITQHELDRIENKTILGYVKNIIIVMFMGFSGGWFVSNVLVADYFPNMGSGTSKFLQAIFGFLSYEALLLMGGNANSVVRHLADIMKKRIEREMKK